MGWGYVGNIKDGEIDFDEYSAIAPDDVVENWWNLHNMHTYTNEHGTQTIRDTSSFRQGLGTNTTCHSNSTSR